MDIKVKRLKWGGGQATTTMCRYDIEHTSHGKYKAASPTFSWYPDKEFNNKKAAMEACQRHWVRQVVDLLEGDDDGVEEI